MAEYEKTEKPKVRPITHTYIVRSTDPLMAKLSRTGTPMLLPRHMAGYIPDRRGIRARLQSAVNGVLRVGIYMEEINNE